MKTTDQEKNILIVTILMAGALLSTSVRAEEPAAVSTPSAAPSASPSTETPAGRPPSELVRLLWAASSAGNQQDLDALFNECLTGYEAEAKRLEAQLTSFPARDHIANYKVLNDVATCLFIRAEALMHSGKNDEATAMFRRAIEEFPYAQAWDPSRGGYWSIAEKSQASIDVMSGKAAQQEEADNNKPVLRTIPKLAKPGKDSVVDYTRYGVFLNVGTPNYHYQIRNMKGLLDAVGEGTYPNTADVLRNPGYKKALQEGRLEGSHWNFTNTDDLEAAYYKWATAPEPWGVRLFYLGIIFERAKMYHEALKEYHALVVHFPNTVAWTYWQTPWYPAQAAIAKMRYLLREHPELNLDYKWGKIVIQNSSDNDSANDVTITWPGVLQERNWMDNIKKYFNLDRQRVRLQNIKRRLGQGRVQLVQYDNGHWQMLVDGKPYVIHGLTYAPTKVGQSPDKGTLTNWMFDDFNHNGRIDGPYDSFVDKNGNNKQDPDEPTVGDFQLMKQMGVNTLRIYHQPLDINKPLLREMYQKYGIMVIMGDYVGKYTLGSGAAWAEGTDYENPQHKAAMMASVRKMVEDLKDEPFILMWLLGNENNYGVACNADKKPAAYYQFVNEVAKMIKSIDPNHPVAIGNGDTLFLDTFAKNAPDVDIYGANVYRGDYGFGSFWQQVQDATDKPAFITEYGAPAYAKHVTPDQAQEMQAAYHRGNWMDIDQNRAGYADGTGNSLGGVTFEWMDEWWKNYEPAVHDRKADVIGPFPGGYYFEEWFGINGQGDGKMSPYLRQPRKVYYTYRELWKSGR